VNRRGFLGSLLRAATAGALASATRFLPMPAVDKAAEWFDRPRVHGPQLTLAQWAGQHDPNSSVAAIAELLSMRSPLLAEVSWLEVKRG